MSRLFIVLLFAATTAVLPAGAQPLTRLDGHLKVEPRISFQAEPFSIQQVTLLDGPFKEAEQRDVSYMLALEPDRLLHFYRKLAGLEPKGEPYGGWETTELAGHTLGHYLSALALYYAHSHDELFLSRINYIVDELDQAQQAGKDGYVGAIPDGRKLWSEIARGDIYENYGFSLNGIWSPWYTLHKLYAGLIDVYYYTGSAKALSVTIRMADWAYELTKNLTPEQWQRMLDTEFGGMSESLADLYAITGDPRYLELSFKFHHEKVMGPLVHHREALEGHHSNTQIPKVIGAVRQYELIGSDSLQTLARFFWEQVIDGHTYVTGGNTQDEYFGPSHRLANRLKATTTETCNTYNMLKLTRHLYALEPSVRYADYYERALYNHILASQEPKQGMMTYLTSLKPGHFKTYSTPEGAFWCCVGSGMENHVRYGEAIYFRGENDLYVNLFIASELDWKEKGLVLRQETRFPESNTIRLVMSGTGDPERLRLHVRHPGWAEGALFVTVNGESIVDSSQAGGYLVLDRVWKQGDVVEVAFPMTLHLETMPDNDRRVAILYGPIVLAGRLGTEGMPEGGAFDDDHLKFNDFLVPPVPVLRGDPDDVSRWVRPVEGHPLTFTTVRGGFPRDVELIPFYQMHHERYTVYWDFVPAKRANHSAKSGR